MTGVEFEQWFDQFSGCYPAVLDFVRKTDATGEQTKTVWLKALSKRDLADALAATIAMFDGDLVIPGADRGWPDWSQVPKIVSRWCADRSPIEPEWKKEARRADEIMGRGIIKTDPGMAAALRKALVIIGECETSDPEEKRAWLKQRMVSVREMLRGEFTKTENGGE